MGSVGQGRLKYITALAFPIALPKGTSSVALQGVDFASLHRFLPLECNTMNMGNLVSETLCTSCIEDKKRIFFETVCFRDSHQDGRSVRNRCDVRESS